MLVRIHKSYRDVVSICDSDMIGKKFEEKNMQLDIRESFFNGDEKTEEECIEIMKSLIKEDATFNIVGKKSTEAALKAGIISKKGVKKIDNIPYALVLL